jgi:hypothetical protein
VPGAGAIAARPILAFGVRHRPSLCSALRVFVPA